MKKDSSSNTKPRIQLRYPRSFLGLLLVGFAIVALPLIAGLMSNAFSIERLAEQSQQAIFNTTVATRNARQLSTVTVPMERSARLYAASGDRSLIDAYKQSRYSFRKFLGEFVALPLASETQAAANLVQQKEAGIFKQLTQTLPSQELKQQFERDFADLAMRIQALNT